MRTAQLAPQSPAPDSAQAKKPSAWKQALKLFLLFAAGLILGLGLFFPRQTYWDWLLSAAAGNIPGLHISTQGLSHASWRSIRIHRLQLDYQERTLVLPNVDLHLGLSPLLQANTHAGDQMDIRLERGRQVHVQGQGDLSELLPAEDLKGTIDLQAQLKFQTWEQPPVQGKLKLQSNSQIQLSRGLVLEDLKLDARLRDNRLLINSLQTQAPIHFSCTGQVQLQWSDLLASEYQVQGELQSSEQPMPFNQQGQLADVAKDFQY
ncbi:MAG: hypothetical protein ACOCY9_00140 [Desulfohalobiaceae bacterium]